MSMKKGTFLGMVFVIFLVLAMAVPAVWAQPSVSLNPSYAQRNCGGKVRMHIEMSGATNLLSMGIKVTFDPSLLQVESAEKNTEVWKFEPLEPNPEAYLPEVEIDNVNGVVKMIGGRLKPGVSGDVLLGWIVFKCSETNTRAAEVNVELANASPYNNFVREDGTVDDESIVFTGATICIVDPEINPACEGDFNNNYAVDGADFFRFRKANGAVFPAANYDPAADFNANGAVDGSDFFLFRQDNGRTDCPICSP